MFNYFANLTIKLSNCLKINYCFQQIVVDKFKKFSILVKIS